MKTAADLLARDQARTRAARASAQPARAATRSARGRAGVRYGGVRSVLSVEGTGRLESTWSTTPTEIDAFIVSHWSKIVARARDMGLRGDHGKKFVQLCRDNIAGPSGFTLQPQITDTATGKPDKAVADAIFDAYAEFSKRDNFTVTGTMTRADYERLAVAEWSRSGEFISITRRGAQAGPWGIAHQVVDPLRLDPTYCEQLSDGRFIKHSIEFSPLGRPLAYHFWKESPLVGMWGGQSLNIERERIPAADVRHVFLPEFSMQKRGLSPMISALARMRVLQNYEDSALVNADISARKTGFFRDLDADSDDVDQSDLPMDAEAGVFENIGNREFVAFDPQYPTGEYEPFTRQCIRAMASGLGVSYNNLASDLTSVNFSSIRQGALDEREVWKGYQDLFISALCLADFRVWLEIAILSGRITVKGRPLDPAQLNRYLACTFVGRRWGWIDPASEIAANKEAIALRIKSRSQAMRDAGQDPWATWSEINSEEAEMRGLGLDPTIVVAGAAPAKPTQPEA